jgi:hypothetical protein
MEFMTLEEIYDFKIHHILLSTVNDNQILVSIFLSCLMY